MQISKQISNANILAPVRDNPSKFSLRGRPESLLQNRSSYKMKGVVIQNERSSYKMKGHSNFLPCFWVILDVLRLIEMGQNVVIIQVFDPASFTAHPSCIGNSRVALYKNAAS